MSFCSDEPEIRQMCINMIPDKLQSSFAVWSGIGDQRCFVLRIADIACHNYVLAMEFDDLQFGAFIFFFFHSKTLRYSGKYAFAACEYMYSVWATCLSESGWLLSFNTL